ncbi:MAG TPA: phosphotransferase family protein [Mycobacteriales bacterium]|nr:phosphotransferase family protein [Mycobacteriales bacterium]
MSPPSVTPTGELVAVTRAALVAWLGRDDLDVQQIGGGASNLTFAVRTGREELVLRRPPAFVTPTSNDMRREWTVLRALARTDVPVPRVVRTCEDPAVLGVPFYLMERLDGIVFRSAQDVGHLDVRESRECTEELIRVLAALHALDPATVGLEDFGRPEGFLARQVRRWTKQWERTAFAEVPEIDEVSRRLAAAVPPSGPPAIVHGDYSFNNTMFHREPPTRMLGVLDWELSTIGDPMTDVGMLALYWGDIGASIWTGQQAHRANPGFGTSAAMLERYAAVSGRDLGGIDFHLALATFKMAVIVAGARARTVGVDPDRTRTLEDKTRMLASVALEATDDFAGAW